MSLQRGVLAEGMYRRANETAPKLPSYGAAKPEYQQFIDLENKRNHLRSAADKTMISATDCLVAQQPAIADRSEERRVGKECVSTCRSRWSQSKSKKKQPQHPVPQTPTNEQT